MVEEDRGDGTDSEFWQDLLDSGALIFSSPSLSLLLSSIEYNPISWLEGEEEEEEVDPASVPPSSPSLHLYFFLPL